MDRLAAEFAASPSTVEKAYGRALRRTASNIRRLSTSGLKSELGLRNTKALRRRLKEYRYRRGSGQSIRLWYGANDLPLSAFKGRPKEIPGGIEMNGVKLIGAFFARPGGSKRGVYRRIGDRRFPIVEARLPVVDRMMIFLEDEVFVDLDSIFLRNFASEIRARTIFDVGSRYG